MKTSEPGPLLTAAGLQVQFQTKDGPRQVLHGVDYHIDRGEIVGIIGETGSGKSMSLRAALGMLPRSASLTAGTALFQGRDLLRMSAKELRSIKGEEIGFVP
nr:ATP-binding cassette domain-containing protein [Pseudomonas sp.]